MRASIDTCSGGSSDAGPLLRAIEHVAERGHEAEQIDFHLGLGRLADDLGDAAVRTAPLRAPLNLLLVQQLGRGLEPLMLEQAAHERLARILLGILLRGIVARQQHPRLDVDERRRHHEKFTGDIETQFGHQIQVFEVLLRDEDDRDVVDVHLVLLDEVQQQIERALEVLQADRIVAEDRLELDLFGFAGHDW